MYNGTWEKVTNMTKKKEFESELVHNKKYLKAEKKVNTVEIFQCIYTQVILIHSVYRNDGNYYPKVFLAKYNYWVIEGKMSVFNDDMETHPDGSYSVDTDEEHFDCNYSDDSDKEYSDEKNKMKKINA